MNSWRESEDLVNESDGETKRAMHRIAYALEYNPLAKFVSYDIHRSADVKVGWDVYVYFWNDSWGWKSDERKDVCERIYNACTDTTGAYMDECVDWDYSDQLRARAEMTCDIR